MKIHVLRCGSICVARPALDGVRKRLNVLGGIASPEKSLARVPVYAYLIEHSHGLVLIDTGWSRSLFPDGKLSREAAKDVLPSSLTRYFRPELPLGEAVSERLADMGLAAEDLDCVILTQLSADHSCGLRDLAGAKKLLVSENERFWSCRSVFSARQPRALWDGTGLEIFYMRGTTVGPRKLSYDLFGDGSFLLTETPGYTLGQTAALVYSGAKYALISSDISFSADDLRAGIPAGHLFAPDMGRRSLDWLQKTALAPECAVCLVNHDAADENRPVITV